MNKLTLTLAHSGNGIHRKVRVYLPDGTEIPNVVQITGLDYGSGGSGVSIELRDVDVGWGVVPTVATFDSQAPPREETIIPIIRPREK